MDPIETITANQLATGAPGTIKIGDQTYLVSQPSRADYMTLRKHLAGVLKRTKIAPLAAIAPELAGLPPEFQKMAIEAAVKIKESGREATNDNITELLMEPAGVAFWAWLLIRKNEPAVSLAEFEKAITVENVDAIAADLLAANGLSEAVPN